MINSSKILSCRILVVSSLLFLCLLHGGNHHGVLSFSSPHFLLSSFSLRYVQSLRRNPSAILESGIVPSLYRHAASLNLHTTTESDDDKKNDNVDDNVDDNDNDNDNDNDEMFNIAAALPLDEDKGGINNRWILPQHKQRPLHGAFDSDLVVETSTAGTSVKKVDDADHVGAIGLVVWMVSLCAFVFVNNFVVPWPNSVFDAVPDRIWRLGHFLGGMFFGGGIILTACVEWLVRQSKNVEVMRFWFDKVPLLQTSIVLPGLTLSILSGTALTTVRYGGLSNAPPHIIYTFWTMLVFAAWWGFTDLTTQGGALEEVLELELEHNDVIVTPMSPSVLREVPEAVNARMLSNAVSCSFVFLLYAIKVLKLGTVHYW